MDDPGRHPDAIASLAPILWAAIATPLERKVPAKVLNAIGIILTAALALVVAIPLAFYLR